jgi:glucose/arabinose dehydrogenase
MQILKFVFSKIIKGKSIEVVLLGLSLFLVANAANAEVLIQPASDYKAAIVANMDRATAFTFDFEGNYIVAKNIGLLATKNRAATNVFDVIKVHSDGTSQSLLDRTGQIITNLSFYQGNVYVVSRGQIFKIAKGKLSDVISSLPVYGDYANGNVIFYGGYMYYAVGTATNSGIVGADNSWLSTYPFFHDVPCAPVQLSGVSVETDNFLTAAKGAKATTGAFMPFNTPASAGQTIYGMSNCSGAVIKASPDGSQRQVYAWGLHNPKGLSVDDNGQLWVLDSGMEDRGVRPIKNGKDALYQISQNTWYGWPDFSAGIPVDQRAVLSQTPNNPPQPQGVYDLNQFKYLLVSPKKFSGNAIAQTADDKLIELNLSDESISDFLTVKGAKIIQYKFGPDGKLYVLVDLQNGKTQLYSIENTKPAAVAGIVSTKSKNSTTLNWMLGLALAIFTGSAGFYVIKNLKRPIEPL